MRFVQFHPTRNLCLAAVFGALLGPVSAATVPEAEGDSGATPQAYWVFFRDRGDQRLDPTAILQIAEGRSPNSWALRAAASGHALPDARDLPLWEPYVEEVAEHGRIRHRTLWLNGVSADLTPGGLAEVRTLPFVREVRPVARARRQSLGPPLSPDGTPLGRTLALKREPERGPSPYGPSYGQLMEIGVPTVHAAGYTGNRVRMMMIDTGFREDHDAFAQTIVEGEWDFVSEDGETQNEPGDDLFQHYHGTGCWAVAGGYDPDHIVGPAYGATFFLSKTEDVVSETQAEEDNYVAALEWAYVQGVRVASASLAYVCFDDGFCYDFPLKDGDTPVISRAVDIAAERGILVVNSAGNYGYAGPMSLGTPADADSMIAVGAVDSLNVVVSFSSRGPSDDGRTKPEVMARGYFTWWADASEADTYGFAAGTSLSCPLVGGAAALLAEAHPEWGAMDIREALLATADRSQFPDNDYGWGRIDASIALSYTPVLYPVPFSLVSPEDNAQLSTLQPTFVWRSSRDPDDQAPLTYRLRLRSLAPGGPEWALFAGADTSLTLEFVLSPGHVYAWEVEAEDQDGLRRFSREVRYFFTPGGADSPAEPLLPEPIEVRVGPNPFTDRLAFDVRAEAGGPLRWSVFDPLGRRVAGGGAEPVSADTHRGVWDGRDTAGRPLPAGIYYLELQAGTRSVRRTLVRLVPGS